MGFLKKGNLYMLTRMTGNQNNILGITFGNAKTDSIENQIEVNTWELPEAKNSPVRTSKEEVFEQVVSALNSVNQDLGTSYTLSKIYYVPSEDGSNFMYRTLLRRLIKHYHEGKKFQES